MVGCYRSQIAAIAGTGGVRSQEWQWGYAKQFKVGDCETAQEERDGQYIWNTLSTDCVTASSLVRDYTAASRVDIHSTFTNVCLI